MTAVGPRFCPSNPTAVEIYKKIGRSTQNKGVPEMLFTSPVYSQASGSIAGITYSHNRGGMYTRARVTPTDPSSSRQQQMRAAIGTLAPYWGQTLTQGERDAWDLYADNVPWINPIGQTIYLTGQQHFIRVNSVHLQIGEAVVEAAPSIYDLGTFTQPVFAGATSAPQVEVNFTDTDLWANGAGGFMLIYTGKSVGQGRAFYRGPWRYTGRVVGDTTPPSSPFTGPPPWAWSAGNQAWIQIRFIQTDARMSLPVILGPRTIT